MRTTIYFPPSAGCEVSAQVLVWAIQAQVQQGGGTLRRMSFPHMMSAEALARDPSAGEDIDCAFFLEQMAEHPALLRARHRILIPNPEWLEPRTMRLAQRCTHVWHKSRFSLERLAPLIPQAEHAYLGYSSPDPWRRVTGFDSFVHLRGKLLTNRNTDALFEAWKAHPDWPDLHVHFYLKKEGGIAYPGWLHDGNVHVKMGWLDREPYFALAAAHGIHLCTSEVESFGHYINEARAMGALVVAVDGSPMNELIDENCGVLARPSRTTPMHQGLRYHVTAEDMAAAVERVLALSSADRRALGHAARERFLSDRAAFLERVRARFEALWD